MIIQIPYLIENLLFLYKGQNIMNETKLKNTIVILVITILLLLTTISVIVTNHRVKPKQPETKKIVITDTISKVVYDTVYIKEYKTVKLPVDTLYRDSVRIDSVFVEIPISVYKLDTTFTTDSTNLNLFIQNSGYEVKLDSLFYKFEYRQASPVIKKKRHRFGFFVGPAVGVGYDYLNNKPIPTVGIGVGIGWSLGKY